MQDDDGRHRGRARVRAREPRGQVPDEEGHQRSSAVIRGHQRAEDGSTRAYQWSSEVIRGHQRAEGGAGTSTRGGGGGGQVLEAGGGRYQYSRRCSSFSPREHRSSKPTRRYTHLMREVISMRSEMQSACAQRCNQHGIGCNQHGIRCNQHGIRWNQMQSRTPALAPDDRPDRLMRKTISRHSACTQHGTQHGTQHALIRTR
jgi:hypothetical protein